MPKQNTMLIKLEIFAKTKYNAYKIGNFLELKEFVSRAENYAYNFTIEEITEGEILEEKFYGAYVFDEDNIANRKTNFQDNSCWKKLIVFLASKDKVNISNYYICTAGGLTSDESENFYQNINPLQNEKDFNE